MYVIYESVYLMKSITNINRPSGHLCDNRKKIEKLVLCHFINIFFQRNFFGWLKDLLCKH